MAEEKKGTYVDTGSDNKRGINMESEVEMEEMMKPDNEIIEKEGEVSGDKDSKETNAEMYIISEEQMQKEIDKIKEMNFIELLSYEKALDKQKTDIEQTKQFAESLIKLHDDIEKSKEEAAEKGTSSDNLSKEIQLADLNSKLNIDPDELGLHDFLDNYDVSMDRLNKTSAFLKDRLHEFDDVKKTTKYMNQLMTEIAEKRIKEIDDAVKDDPYAEGKYKLTRRHYERMIKLYETRDDITPIIEKVDSMGQLINIFYTNVLKEEKNNKSISIDSARRSASKEFTNLFSMEQMQAFDNYMEHLLNPEDNENDFSPFMTQYALYLVHKDIKARQKNLNKNIDMLIMNVLDIISENYDMDRGVEYFNDQLLELRKVVKGYMRKTRGKKK